MKQPSKLIWVILGAILLGIIVAQIKFIPSWEVNQGILILFFFIVALVAGIFYSVKKYQSNAKSNAIISAILSILGIPMLCFVTISIVFDGQLFFLGPTFQKEIETNGNQFYIYSYICSPPDSNCQCDDYYSLVYIKNKNLPIMHLVTKVDFYAGGLDVKAEELMIKPSKMCPKDAHKVAKTTLK